MAREPDLPRPPEREPAAGERTTGDQPGGAGDTGDRQGGDESIGATLVLLARLAGIGWTVAAAIAAGAVGGWWLDGRLGTRPWLTLAGTVLGAAAAFTAMVRLLQAVSGGPKRKQGK